MANPPANSPHWQYIRRVLGEPGTPARILIFAYNRLDAQNYAEERGYEKFIPVVQPEHLLGLHGSEYKAHFTNRFFDRPHRYRSELIELCEVRKFEMVNYKIVHTDPHAPTEADTIAADLLEEYGFPEQADKLRNGPILTPGYRYRLDGYKVYGSRGPFELRELSYRMEESDQHRDGVRVIAEAEFDCTPEALMPRQDPQASE